MRDLERRIVIEFGKQLRQKYPWVDIHRKPSVSKPLQQKLKERLSYIPILQPEIDVCFIDDCGLLLAAEVKVFSANEISFNLPFYEGIGQALALHRFGFDFVSLWLFFYGNIDLELMNRYGAQAWHFIRNELRLPLDFTFFNAMQQSSSFNFIVYQYTNDRNAFQLCPFEEFEFVFRHPNPLRYCTLPKVIRSKLEPWLKLRPSKVK